MRLICRSTLLGICVFGLAALGATPEKKPAEPAKSALDKATLEAYVRHLFVWGKDINVEVSDPKPSPDLTGFLSVDVKGSAGTASQVETFLISKDGRKIVRAAVFDVNQNPFKTDLDKLKTQFQPSLGTEGAPVVLVMFSDFECPACKQEAVTLRQSLLSAYPREVRLYFKDFPLETLHPWARAAAVAGRCIFRQNPASFWDYFDWVYEHQADINADNFKAQFLAFAKTKSKDVDEMQLTSCLDSGATNPEVDRSVAEGKALRIGATPTLFINGRRIEGGIPWPNLKSIIDYEIEYQKTAKNAGENCDCEVKVASPVASQAPRR